LRRFFFVLSVLLAGAAGFLLGRATPGSFLRGDGRPEVKERSSVRRLVQLPAEEAYDLRAKAMRSEALEKENARLRAEAEKLRPPAEEELPVGSRRPDQSIVGGARWSEDFMRMATGFLDSLIDQFIAEADLTPEQERRLRARVRQNVRNIMGVTAEYTNGDLDGDLVYERPEIYMAEGQRFVDGLLNEEQHATYQRFLKDVNGQINHWIVNDEMASLRAELNLDPEQAKHVQAIVEERYRLVQERVRMAIPNVMFKPIRREKDREIYEESAKAIRGYLTPEQAVAFDRAENKALSAPHLFRNMLVPKGK
jgi:hypothetical protein